MKMKKKFKSDIIGDSLYEGYYKVKNENDMKKDNPSMFLKIII